MRPNQMIYRVIIVGLQAMVINNVTGVAVLIGDGYLVTLAEATAHAQLLERNILEGTR